jgi:serine O-acetyltransferase
MSTIFQSVRDDIRAIRERDPAARSYLEVLFCYPGLHALWFHRINHSLWNHGFRFLARFFSQVARILTLIEIHPGAQIGHRLFIDHGSAVVIGETAIVGDDVTMYQGVTLGGTGKEHGKRHPTIGNDVVIGSGAKVLGNITVGNNCRVGAGSVVLRSIPDNSTIVGVPGHIVLRNGKRVVISDPKEISDPMSDLFVRLAAEVHQIREQVEQHTAAKLEPEPIFQFDEEHDAYQDGAGI